MSRLRDLQSQDPVIAEAAALLRAARPTDLDQRPNARAWQQLRAKRRRSPRLLGLRPAIALALLLLLGALAGATVFRGWRSHFASTVTPPAPSSPARARHHGARAASSSPVEPIVLAPTTTSPEAFPVGAPSTPTPAPSSPAPIKTSTKPAAVEAPAAPLPRARPAVATTPVTTERAPSRASSAMGSTPPAPAPAQNAEAPDLLLRSAVRALRFEHDAKHAGELADTYLALYPDDDLVEEAMAIGIEAHKQLDDGLARSLAARYLTRFPNGRFRAAALSAH